MEIMYDVVTIGSVVLDITVRSRDFRVVKGHQMQGGVGLCEVYGGKTDIDELTFTVGGGSTNAAVSFLRKGHKVGTVMKLGDDEMGTVIEKELDRYAINKQLMVKEEGGRSAVSVILVAPDGGRSILTYRGVSKDLESNEIDWEKLETTKWLYISSLGGQMSLLEDIVVFAANKGIKVAFNPGKAELVEKERLMRLLPKIEVLLVNRMELASLLGMGYENRQELLQKVKELDFKEVVVMTEGKEGSVVISHDRLVRAEAFKVKSVDDTGAGDAFGSGFVDGMIRGWSLADCLKAGAANGASEVTKVGVKEGLLSEKELNKWMKRELEIVEEGILVEPV